MDTLVTRENVLEMSQYMIAEYYQLNVEPFFSVMTKDCVWILPGGEIAIGKEAMRSLFRDGSVMPSFLVEEIDLDLLATASSEQIGVFGTYSLYSDVESELVFAEKQRITLMFRREKANVYKCYHLHVSDEYTNLDEDENFPVQISRQTYHYLQKLMKASDKCMPVLLQSNRATYRFDPDMVLYVEAVSKVCTVHMLGRTVVVRQSLSEVQQQFPNHFYRIHRSYLINCHFVLQMERYLVTLVDGTTLPIPEKRFMEVRRSVTDLMKKGNVK